MKKYIMMAITAYLFLAASWAYAETELESATDYLNRKMFVVETDEDMASESLHRISGGHYDRGFAPSNASYQSSTHQGGRSGPFSESDDRGSFGPGFSY